jgi:hypothetical protein
MDKLDLRAARARDDLTRAVNEAATTRPPVAGVARRAARRRARFGALAVAAVVTVGSVAVWSGIDRGSSSKVVAGQPDNGGGTPAPPAVPLDTEGPPPINLRAKDHAIEVRSHAFCWSPIGGNRAAVCVDGRPGSEVPDIGTIDEIELTAPWASEITAYAQSPGQPCGRSFRVPVNRQPNGDFRLGPAGYPATYDVRLSAKGPNGSAEYLFRWTTTVRGPLPTPTARISMGSVELAVDQLARTPTQAAAMITVTAANGRSLTFEALRAPDTCRPEGSLYWNGPAERARAAAALGPAPYRYDIALLLDGVKHTATATWPDDQIPGLEPNVALHFKPPLRGLS